MKLAIEANLENITSRADNSWTIKLSTQELDGSGIGQLSDLKRAGGYCKVLISNTNISKLEEELIDNTQLVACKKMKTESQRLRAVLFRYAEQQQVEFETFYKIEMVKIISHYKSKLE